MRVHGHRCTSPSSGTEYRTSSSDVLDEELGRYYLDLQNASEIDFLLLGKKEKLCEHWCIIVLETSRNIKIIIIVMIIIKKKLSLSFAWIYTKMFRSPCWNEAYFWKSPFLDIISDVGIKPFIIIWYCQSFVGNSEFYIVRFFSIKKTLVHFQEAG